MVAISVLGLLCLSVTSAQRGAVSSIVRTIQEETTTNSKIRSGNTLTRRQLKSSVGNNGNEMGGAARNARKSQMKKRSSLPRSSGKGGGKGGGGEGFCFKTGMGYDITGTSDPDMTGRTDGFDVGTVPSNSDSACFDEGSAVAGTCNSLGPEGDVYDATVDDYFSCLNEAGYYDEPWWFNRDVYGQFNFQSGGANIGGDGDGFYHGIIPDHKPVPNGILDPVTNNYAVKNELEYWLLEMRDEPAGKLSGISFDYYIESCADGNACGMCGVACNTMNCAAQIYVNLYFRSDSANESFYDCKFDYVASTFGSGQAIQQWHKFSIDMDSEASSVVSRGSVGCSLSNTITAPKTIKEAAGEGFVLGTKSPACSDNFFTFKLNIGDSNCQDAGMNVYFDNVEVLYEYESGESVHRYNMVG